MLGTLNHPLQGWAAFYQYTDHTYTDHTATLYARLDRLVFWRFGHWLARKYHRRFPALLCAYGRQPAADQAKTWGLRGRDEHGLYRTRALRRLVGSRKGPFRGRTRPTNPYLQPEAVRPYESRYPEVAFALRDT